MKKTPSAHAERRKSRRRPVRLKVDGIGETVNVAEGGLLLQSEKKLRIGEIFRLHIVIPGSTEPVTCLGKILWVRQESPRGKTEVGVAFQERMPIFRSVTPKAEKHTRRAWGVWGIGLCLVAGGLLFKYFPLLGKTAAPLGIGIAILFFASVAVALTDIAEGVVR